MKKIFALTGLCFLLLGNSYADAQINYEHYVFRYDSGDTYDVQFTDNLITWTGLEGSGTGRTESDALKRKKLSNEVEVMQWQEFDGTFVTVVFDRPHMRVVSSGETKNNETWLSFGIAENKQT